MYSLQSTLIPLSSTSTINMLYHANSISLSEQTKLKTPIPSRFWGWLSSQSVSVPSPAKVLTVPSANGEYPLPIAKVLTVPSANCNVVTSVDSGETALANLQNQSFPLFLPNCLPSPCFPVNIETPIHHSHCTVPEDCSIILWSLKHHSRDTTIKW